MAIYYPKTSDFLRFLFSFTRLIGDYVLFVLDRGCRLEVVMPVTTCEQECQVLKKIFDLTLREIGRNDEERICTFGSHKIT